MPNLTDLPATLEVWTEALDGAPLPLSPVEVPWLPVPDARLQVDCGSIFRNRRQNSWSPILRPTDTSEQRRRR